MTVFSERFFEFKVSVSTEKKSKKEKRSNDFERDNFGMTTRLTVTVVAMPSCVTLKEREVISYSTWKNHLLFQSKTLPKQR